MITLDSASGYLQIPKVYDYQDLMDNIRNILQLDYELFKYLYFSYIDEKEQERIRLNPQIFDDFISQETPKLSIGFMDNVDENIMDEFKEIIDLNKKRFKKIGYKIEDKDIIVPHKNDINNDIIKEKIIEQPINKDENNNNIILEKENEIQIKKDKVIDSEKESDMEIVREKISIEKEKINNDNNQNIINNNIINNKISGNFNLFNPDNINNIDNINNNDSIKKVDSLNMANIDISEINLLEFDKNINDKIIIEDKKEIEEDDFSKNIENIINSNIENIKDDIIHSILIENSRIQQKSKKNNKNFPKNNYIHQNYECNICNVYPIKGIRYHCLECKDFDICEKCENLTNHNHPLYKIKNDKLYKFKNE